MSALIEKLLPEADVSDDGSFGALRRKAQKVLMQHGFPQRKTENWKYLPLGLLEKRTFSTAGPLTGPVPAPPEFPFETGIVHMHNGLLDPQRCRLPRGVAITGMLPSDIDASKLDDTSPADAFAWLNLARFDQGWKLRVEGRVEQPLAIVTSCDEDFEAAIHPRLKVELAEGAALTLLEVQHSEAAGLINGVLDLELAPKSSLVHLIDRSFGETALIQRTTARVSDAAEYRAFVLDGGGRLTRQDLMAELDAAGASASISGVAALGGRALVDYHTAIEHLLGRTSSRENFRILADDQAVGVFNGRIHIVPGADDSHSEMNTGNLLLSEDARINTKPELEIHAEDVTASHGATIGQLDDDARFYLRSRGLTDGQAIALLKYGFAAAVFDGMDAGALKEWMLERLEACL
ncbi:MAG: SufD family Fe-S cluster assembly protein [Wenzhouxiangellaceae bacterium]|jgi:Fe-S cluster assembly protein SufD|nr:SufD family Fe-S cluster assembly protein [Wenzhouxiangellaceae bacterium]MBS3747085.1 SufD family Fe-S cluster assembly protein [Wenzhouxiangellaceae bacterium]MBS3823491.1 SufD family Fe-S cluster assembly protein [Wenzhouxiangellaceae bacterium]